MMEGHQNMEEELKQDKYKSSSNESDESEDNIAERMNQFDAQFVKKLKICLIRHNFSKKWK